MAKPHSRFLSFDFKPGTQIARKYEVISMVGSGWESEVYKLKELSTGILRAGKFFFPKRNPENKTLVYHAKKLHKLRQCDVLIRYHTQERLTFKQNPVQFLVSDYIDGPILSEFVKKQPNRRLQPYVGLHLLYSLARGMEPIHKAGEYHGDLHSDNVIVQRMGLEFDLKILDFFHWGRASKNNTQDDVVNLIKIFHECLGGAKTYKKQPPEIKEICKGLRKPLISQMFPNAGALRLYLEGLNLKSPLKMI